MTDQIPANLTREEAQAVREWAERALADPNYHSAEEVAAARVLLAVLPRPTLADMTPEERAECQRMQANVKGYENRAVILQPYLKNGSARVMWATLRVEAVSWAHITPRPDLPRFGWPGEQQPAPALPDGWKLGEQHPALALPAGWKLADHEKYGRVVVTSDTPDADGHVYFVAPAPDPIGNDWHLCQRDELTYLDTPAQPNTLTVGSTWDDAAALARACDESQRDQIIALDKDGYAFIWSHAANWWEGTVPPIDPPYTILHTGKHPSP